MQKQHMDDRIPICLITGFLGSGKTTLLQRIAGQPDLGRLVFLVNEFSPRDVDGALVSNGTSNVITIPGGSIFCKCLVTEFISNLTMLPQQFGTPDGVIIEASGMANPNVMQQMLEETRLDLAYRLAHVVSIVDPGTFLKLQHVLPNIVAQIEAADTIIINKADLHTRETMEETKKALRAIHPDASVLTAIHGDVACEWLPAHEPGRDVSGDYAACRDPNYRSESVALAGKIDLVELRRQLTSVGDSLYRLKGFVRHAKGMSYIDYSASGLTITPCTSDKTPGLAVIARGGPSVEIDSLLRWLLEAAEERDGQPMKGMP